MADYTLSVKVTGDISDCESKMQKLGSTIDNMKKKIDGAGFENVASKMSAIGKDLTKVGSALTSKITKPAMVAGGALAGITLAKGWARMTDIDNARAKLLALGNTGPQVETIMNNALKSVKGTAYGMDAAATTAASAVAAGIAPGKQLTRYLTNVADAAAVAGIDMNEMGAIFNKVAANGKISAEEMNQLADRGIPIWRLLADTTGQSMDEVRAAVSSGKIGIEELQKAIEEGMGGAAKTIGSTTITGAISNFNAAISRVGANLIGTADNSDSIAGKLLPLFNSLNKAMGVVEEKASGVGESLAAMFGPAIDKVTDFFNRFGEGKVQIDAMTAKIAAFGGAFIVALGPTLSIVGKLMSAIAPMQQRIAAIAKLFGTTSSSVLKFAGVAGLVVTAFMLLYTKSESFREAINQLVGILANTFAGVFRALSPLLETAGTLLGSVAQAVGGVLGPAIKAVTPIISLLLKAFTKMLTVVTTVMNAVLKVVNKVVSAVASKLNFSGVVGKVKSVFNSVKTAITQPIDKARTSIKNAVDKIKGIFNRVKLKLGLKIPHISISGGKAPWGIAGKGKLPSFHVNWRAKGAVFSSPTIFNTPQGLQGVGEAGPEAVAPIKTLQSYVTAAVTDAGGQVDYARLEDIVNGAISDLDFRVEINLDGTKVANVIAKPVQKALNKIQSRDNRKLGYV